MTEFSKEAQKRAAEHENLGPDYFDAQDVADRYMSHFEEKHLKPMVEKITETIRDAVWDDFATWLLSDTEGNLATKMREQSHRIVVALLSDEPHPALVEKFISGYRAEYIRKALIEKYSDEIKSARIKDLERENAFLKEMRSW